MPVGWPWRYARGDARRFSIHRSEMSGTVATINKVSLVEHLEFQEAQTFYSRTSAAYTGASPLEAISFASLFSEFSCLAALRSPTTCLSAFACCSLFWLFCPCFSMAVASGSCARSIPRSCLYPCRRCGAHEGSWISPEFVGSAEYAGPRSTRFISRLIAAGRSPTMLCLKQ